MWSLIKFTLIANAVAAATLFGLTLINDFIANILVINLMFLTGVFFWLISTIIRLSSKRFKKEWNRDEVIVTDPQLVLKTNNLATRFLVAGLPGVLCAIIWGMFYG